MKLLSSLFLLALALPAFANQPYRGPLLSRDIGKEGENLGLISSCQILGINQEVDWKAVRKDIDQAIKDSADQKNYEIRTYVKFNAPSKLYVAYQPIEAPNMPPKLKQVVLLSDGGQFKALKTEVSHRLLKVISKNCGAIKHSGLGEGAEDDKEESEDYDK